jgi:hypothetical protein
MASSVLHCPRCAALNPSGSNACARCGTFFAMQPDQGNSRAVVEARNRVLIERAKVKSPTLALVLGFLFPALGALYNGRWVLGLSLVLLEVVFDGLSLFSLGMPRLLYSIFGAYLGHKWATEANTASLERLLVQIS